MVWYVATLARYVLVPAQTAEEARSKGEVALGRPAVTVRPATAEELELARWQAQEEGR